MTIRRFRGVLGIRSLITSSGIGALSQFVTFGLNISFIPIFAHTLGATKTDLGTLTTISYVTYGLAALLSAVGGRRFGERAFVIAGSLFTTVTILVLPAIDTVPVLLLLLAVNSFARGMVFPVLMGISIREVPEYERASAMGVFQSVYAIGMFAGPAVAGVVADAIGITGLFLFIAAFPVLSALSALAWLPSRVRALATST
jgi:sugar phosphate permease